MYSTQFTINDEINNTLYFKLHIAKLFLQNIFVDFCQILASTANVVAIDKSI